MKDFFSLSNVKCGQEVTILNLAIQDYKTKTRLYELGFFSGKKVTMVRKSLLGGTLLVKIGTCEFVLRKDVAKLISVQK